MIDRTTFYANADGTPMSDQQKLAHLLKVLGINVKHAADIANVSPATLDCYRKPSSGRPVPDRILIPLEFRAYERIRQLASSAGYRLRRPA